MIFWVLAAVMAAALVVVLLWPLLRQGGKATAAADYDRRVYRDQLAELEQDFERGLIGEAEAAAARREIARRLLQTEEVTGSTSDSRQSAWGRQLALALVICLPPLLGVGLYLVLGTPGLPGLPLATRDPGGPEEVGLMVAQLERRIAEVPQDIEARLVLAQIFERSGRFAEAAESYRGAIAEIASQGPVPGVLHAALGEVLVAAEQGRVGREARLAFAAAIEADPGNARARYYAGLAMAQDGRLDQALQVWESLAADLPAGSPWLGLLREQTARAAAELGIEPPILSGQESPSQAPSAPRGPSTAEVEAAQEMTPEERAAFIRSMVAQLAERLEAAPADPDGWLRLARAYVVLGEADKARDALAAAEAEIAKLPEDSPDRAALAQRLASQRQALSSP
jgi:cytochrome c-type biogenesis protein CcmH